jgi:glutamate synthase (NADPH/NADH)
MVSMENNSWASAIPPKQGLYDPEFEKDACGVGFMVHVKGVRSHKILSDANDILCNMTHRGASGADIRDGDGSGIMTGNLYDNKSLSYHPLNNMKPRYSSPILCK